MSALSCGMSTGCNIYFSAMEAAPTGGNSMGFEYTVIDDIARVDEIWQEAYNVMEEKASKHLYTHSFSSFLYKKMKESEATLRKGKIHRYSIDIKKK